MVEEYYLAGLCFMRIGREIRIVGAHTHQLAGRLYLHADRTARGRIVLGIGPNFVSRRFKSVQRAHDALFELVGEHGIPCREYLRRERGTLRTA